MAISSNSRYLASTLRKRTMTFSPRILQNVYRILHIANSTETNNLDREERVFPRWRVCRCFRNASARRGIHLGRYGSSSWGSSWKGSRSWQQCQPIVHMCRSHSLTELVSLKISFARTLERILVPPWPSGFQRKWGRERSKSSRRSAEIFCSLMSKSASGASILLQTKQNCQAAFCYEDVWLVFDWCVRLNIGTYLP